MEISSHTSRFDELTKDLCHEIDYLRSKLKEQKEETEYWKEKYNDQVNSSLKHSREMTGLIFLKALEEGTEKIEQANKKAQ